MCNIFERLTHTAEGTHQHLQAAHSLPCHVQLGRNGLHSLHTEHSCTFVLVLLAGMPLVNFKLMHARCYDDANPHFLLSTQSTRMRARDARISSILAMRDNKHAMLPGSGNNT